jgi:hypothetical protein
MERVTLLSGAREVAAEALGLSAPAPCVGAPSRAGGGAAQGR